MKLHELKPSAGSTSARKRLGRGNGSGKGTFAGKGVKGQHARSGGKKGGQFEGGQTPLLRRIPKLRGFRNINKVDYAIVNIADLEETFKDGETVDVTALKETRLIQRVKPVKILGEGKLTKKLNVICEAASASAKKAIESAGGSLTLTLEEKSETVKKEDKKEETPKKEG